MPRVSDLYAYPPGTPGVADTTIESADYNAYIDDIKNDLNLPRPIIVGGTGAGDAITALTNLGGEKAKQVVTNYGSTPTGQASWLSGSFYSDAGATGAPTANAFIGFASVQDDNNMVLEACDLTDTAHPIYLRAKVGGAWGAWIKQAAFTDVSAGLAGKVDRTGDTMTGHLSLPIGPAAANAVRKDYVDAADALKADKTYVDAADVLKAPIDSPTFTGDPKAPTPSAGDNDTSIATTAFVATAIATGAAGAVRYDASQILTAAQQQQARQNIYAAPFDAMAYNGLQINGSMEVSQENANNQVPITNGTAPAIIDGWRAQYQNASAVVRASGANAPATPGPFGLAFTSVLTMQATTAFGTAAANDIARVLQYIEGFRWSRLGFGNANAQPVTIAFWIYASIAGNVSVAVSNGAGNRSYVVDVTINSPLTWEYKTVTIPGDQSGAWLTTNGTGASIIIGLGCGTTYQTTPNSWQAGTYFSTASSTRFFTTANNFVQVTGVIVLPGVEAPNAARSPFIVRSVDQELKTCMRYWQIVFVSDSVWHGDGNAYGTTLTFPVVMRAAPTLITSALSVSNQAGGYPQFSASAQHFVISTACVSGTFSNSNGNVKLDARL